MPILVTVSVNLAESVTLRDLRRFVEAAERNGADPEVDLREYDDNNDLVGLAAVGELDSGEDDESDVEDDDEGDEGDVDDDEGDVDDDEGDVDDDEGDVDDDEGDVEGDEDVEDVEDDDDEGEGSASGAEPLR